MGDPSPPGPSPSFDPGVLRQCVRNSGLGLRGGDARRPGGARRLTYSHLLGGSQKGLLTWYKGDLYITSGVEHIGHMGCLTPCTIDFPSTCKKKHLFSDFQMLGIFGRLTLGLTCHIRECQAHLYIIQQANHVNRPPGGGGQTPPRSDTGGGGARPLPEAQKMVRRDHLTTNFFEHFFCTFNHLTTFYTHFLCYLTTFPFISSFLY